MKGRQVDVLFAFIFNLRRIYSSKLMEQNMYFTYNPSIYFPSNILHQYINLQNYTTILQFHIFPSLTLHCKPEKVSSREDTPISSTSFTTKPSPANHQLRLPLPHHSNYTKCSEEKKPRGS